MFRAIDEFNCEKVFGPGMDESTFKNTMQMINRYPIEQNLQRAFNLFHNARGNEIELRHAINLLPTPNIGPWTADEFLFRLNQTSKAIENPLPITTAWAQRAEDVYMGRGFDNLGKDSLANTELLTGCKAEDIRRTIQLEGGFDSLTLI